MRHSILTVVLAFVLVVVVSSCEKNPPPETLPDIVDISVLKMNDFKFQESEYTTIDIKHPVVTNGVETGQGTIAIRIPKGNTDLQLTPLVSNFQKQGFTISPALGVKTDFKGKEVLYTLASMKDPQKKVHYRVTVQEEPPAGTLAITGFRFPSSMNPQFSQDIEAAQIVPGNGSLGKIYVFVPAGTNYSELKGVFDHNGTELRYTQSSFEVPQNSDKIYPSSGMAINYTYPRILFISVKRGDEARNYSVIVDVIKPIVFLEQNVSISGLKAGATQTIKVGELYIRGNRRITVDQVIHSDELPVGNALRTLAGIPSNGIAPGEKADIISTLWEGSFLPGTYQVKASFRPYYYQYPEMRDLLQPSVFDLKVELQ